MGYRPISSRGGIRKGLTWKPDFCVGKKVLAIIVVDCFDAVPNTSYSIWAVHPAISGRSAIAQSFIGKNAKITKAKFQAKIYKGTPKGEAVAALYLAEGTHGTNAKPTGDPLAVSDPVQIESFTTRKFYEFDFPSDQQFKMQSGVTYCIALQVKSATILDGDNYFDVYARSGGHAGNGSHYYSGAWYATTDDFLFYVYGIS